MLVIRKKKKVYSKRKSRMGIYNKLFSTVKFNKSCEKPEELFLLEYSDSRLISFLFDLGKF